MGRGSKVKVEASGGLFISSDTGRVLLQQRSESSSHPRTWSFFGGKKENDELPAETLKRELEEEIGIIPQDLEKIIPINKYTSPDKKFVYHTFVVVVLEEFIPVLNNESDGFAWVKIPNWPRPLHPGVKNQLWNKDIVAKIKAIRDNYLDSL